MEDGVGGKVRNYEGKGSNTVTKAWTQNAREGEWREEKTAGIRSRSEGSEGKSNVIVEQGHERGESRER